MDSLKYFATLAENVFLAAFGACLVIGMAATLFRGISDRRAKQRGDFDRLNPPWWHHLANIWALPIFAVAAIYHAPFALWEAVRTRISGAESEVDRSNEPPM